MLGLSTYFGILAALALGAWLRPVIGVAAVLCLFGLKQWGQSSTGFVVEHGQFTNYAIAVIALVALIRAASLRSCIFCGIRPVSWLIAALLLYALLSVVWAPDLTAALGQWSSQGPYLLAVALIAPLLLNDFEDARLAFFWTALTGGTICILALAFGKWGFRGLLLYADLRESETNPLALSSLAGTVFIIAASSLGRSSSVIKRLLFVFLIPVALAVILRSGSRGQLIAGMVSAMLALPIAFRIRDFRSIAALMLAASIIIGLGMWSSTLVEIDSSRWQGSESQNAVAGRIDNAQQLLKAATASPFTAVFGLGNSSAFQVLGIYPHIAGLEVIAEEGILGGILYFAVICLALRSIKRIAARPDLGDAERNALAVLTGLFVFEFMLSWKQGSLLSSYYVFAYAIVLGRLEANSPRHAGAGQAIDPPSAPRFQNLLR